MEVLALVGHSGTGKSHRAILVANDYQVDAIIDDGLLIQGSRIVAGSSSKRQATKIGAIRTALFADREHCSEVREAIRDLRPNKILILGTSTGMVERIARRLEIPDPASIIYIEDIATPKDIERARYIREKYGKHVVPAPTVELKPRFSGTLIDPLQTWLRRRSAPRETPSRHLWVEQSVVRPTFNFMGKFYISNNVIVAIVSHAAAGINGLQRISKVQIENSSAGVTIHADLVMYYGQPLRPPAEKARLRIIHWVEYMTSLHVLAVHLTVRSLVIEETVTD